MKCDCCGGRMTMDPPTEACGCTLGGRLIGVADGDFLIEIPADTPRLDAIAQCIQEAEQAEYDCVLVGLDGREIEWFELDEKGEVIGW